VPVALLLLRHWDLAKTESARGHEIVNPSIFVRMGVEEGGSDVPEHYDALSIDQARFLTARREL
jgi:hypothetical protein